MLKYEEALELIHELPFAPGRQSLPLMEAEGRILAEAVAAPWPLPRFDNSSMDGFALRARDAAGAGLTCPVEFPVAGESAAGIAFAGTCPPGAAVRISTGASVPEGLDAVVPIELCEAAGDVVRVLREPTAGQNIRRRGEDVAECQALFGAGRRITPAVLAFLAGYNIAEVSVFARPRVAILTSGEELRPYGAVLEGSRIVASSLYYLERELAACGCEPRSFGIAPDDAAAFREHLEAALEWGDLVVTTAGVSVGEHDVVGRVVRELGGTVHFWRVAVRPGKPMMVASFGARHLFALPGNPVSTWCNVEVFLKPFLRRVLECGPHFLPVRRATLADACTRDASRLFFVASRLLVEDGEETVRPLANQSSGNLLNTALANALAIVPAGPEPVWRGERIEVIEVRHGL